MDDPTAIEESPMKLGLQLNLEDNSLEIDMSNIPFRETVGPDISYQMLSYAIGLISRVVSSPILIIPHYCIFSGALEVQQIKGCANSGNLVPWKMYCMRMQMPIGHHSISLIEDPSQAM